MSPDPSPSRRQWLQTCAGIAGAVSVAGCSAIDDDETDSGENNGSGTDSADWPMYGVDRQNTGHHPDVTGPTGDDVTAREVVDTGETGLYPVAIVDGMLYGNAAGQSIYAVDLETEELEWKSDISGPPTVHDGTVYGPISDGTLYGYRSTTGSKWQSKQNVEADRFVTHAIPTPHGIFITSEEAIWQFNIDSGDYNKVIDIPSARSNSDWPAYKDETLYIGRLGTIYAIDIGSAKIKWKFEPDNGGRFFDCNPVVANGLVYIINSEGRVHAVDSDSGVEVWATDLDITKGSPAVDHQGVYLTDSRSVVAVDPDNGSIVWEGGNDLPLEPEDPVVVDGICYVTTSFKIRAYDTSTGKIDWEYERPENSDIRLSASPSVFNETIYISSSNNKLYGIEDA